MTQQLFRQQAVEFSTQRLYGHVVVLPRISHVAVLGFIALCVAALVATLLSGVHVEKQTVPGRLSYSGSAGGAHIDAQLFFPASLVRHATYGKHIELRLPEFGHQPAAPLSAVIESISSELRVTAGDESRPAMVYAPVILRIESSALRGAGLPDSGHYELRIEADFILREWSWMQWLVNCITRGAGKS